jgi:hypothetical protein
MVTVTDKGNYVEINRGEPSRRYVVKPFDVDICGTDTITIGDGLKNSWSFLIADLTGWTYTDIYDLKDQLIALNNKYQVEADIVIGDEVFIKQQLADNKSVVNIPASLTEVLLKGQNTSRRELTIYNNSNGTLYVLYGTGVTSTNYTHKLKIGDSAHLDDYRGVVNGIFTSASGFAMVTEVYY